MILIEGGLIVNILLTCTMKELGMSMDELFDGSLTIQGFNQGG